jgi:hypothetical protein
MSRALHIRLPQGGKIDLEDRSDRLQRFRAGVLPALDTLDRPRAQARQLGELLLRPATLDPEFLDEHLRFFGHRFRPYRARDTTRHVSRATFTGLCSNRILSGGKKRV